jgi:tetratricopeptide (TPR) repeat protein
MFASRILFCLLAAASADVRAPDPWIGQSVVIKHDHPIKVGTRQVPTYGFHVYKVTCAQGDWLWIQSGSVRGWIPAREALPFDQAIDFYSQEIAANPSNAAAWNHRGTIWHELKQYDKAIADHSRAIDLDPCNANLYRSRGSASHDRLDYASAIDDYSIAIWLSDDYLPEYYGCRKFAPDYYHRGNAWMANKAYSVAIADYSEAIRLAPRSAAAYKKRALAWSAKCDYRRAFADYETAMHLDPSDAELQALLDGARREAKRLEEQRLSEIARLAELERQREAARLAAERSARRYQELLELPVLLLWQKECPWLIGLLRFLNDLAVIRVIFLLI